MQPEHYFPLLRRLKKALPDDARKELTMQCDRWLHEKVFPDQARDERTVQSELHGEDSDIMKWLLARSAENEIEAHRSRFTSESPLGYNIYFPPPAPFPPGHSLDAVLTLIPDHLQQDKGFASLIAEGMRLDALNLHLLHEQPDLLVSPKATSIFQPKAVGSGGLGVTYGAEGEYVATNSRKVDKHKESERRRRGKRDHGDDDESPRWHWPKDNTALLSLGDYLALLEKMEAITRSFQGRHTAHFTGLSLERRRG
jgi:hypothetical protein